ncbi:N-acetylmuramoyl-L-alanine amidase [Streptomyces sp. XD-27]|uniref:N-acetylmuramoyl-L-alanine amidase n=1 Tax=Streptomyces sp. XD-27 TaxID=3062779 RepID=UPI0026F476E6|nr:N-acetylmuramoyl-L-alanine amidase [Streptomyces sp. XD-27]WKX70078.1 N-acetylmuramoyl-L-alanine amidase [Streptomyces sp. XD-27]
MSNGSTPPTKSRLRGTLVTLAALALVCGAGWLVWSAIGDHGARDGDDARPAVSHGPTTPENADDSDHSDDSDNSDASGKGSLKGKVVVIDPGHNPQNRRHPSEIARLVDIGTNKKECDTTGAATNSGYAEASFTLDVSRRVREILETRGAKVVFTQDDDRPFGPCVDERAAIGNRAHADAAVSVHADGAGSGDRGFHVIAPATVRGGGADTSAIAAPSRTLARHLIREFGDATDAKPANYLGGGTGLTVRDDLGGLNLSTIPKVFIECGNMRDPKDAKLITDAAWRQRAAQGIAQGITDFLRG